MAVEVLGRHGPRILHDLPPSFKARGLVRRLREGDGRRSCLIFFSILGHSTSTVWRRRIPEHSGSTISVYFHATLNASAQHSSTSTSGSRPDLVLITLLLGVAGSLSGSKPLPRGRSMGPTSTRSSPRVTGSHIVAGRAGCRGSVLAVVDHDAKFLFVLAGWEGSVHDARLMQEAERHGFVVPAGLLVSRIQASGSEMGSSPHSGASGTIHESSSTTTCDQEPPGALNSRHSSAGMAVERAFGMLKNRSHS